MFKSFDSVDEMFDAVRRAGEEADKHVRPLQSGVSIGDHFAVLSDEGFTVYGEVLDPAKPTYPCSVEVAAEIASEAKLYDEPHMRHYRFTRCFSVVCPEGECGDTHVSTIAALMTPEVFEYSRSLGWPSLAERRASTT